MENFPDMVSFRRWRQYSGRGELRIQIMFKSLRPGPGDGRIILTIDLSSGEPAGETLIRLAVLVAGYFQLVGENID